MDNDHTQVHKTSYMFLLVNVWTVPSLPRKLEEANLQNRDMVHLIGKREETIHSTQKQLEERAWECSILSKQLEQAFEDGQRQVCLTPEHHLNTSAVFQFLFQSQDYLVLLMLF